MFQTSIRYGANLRKFARASCSQINPETPAPALDDSLQFSRRRKISLLKAYTALAKPRLSALVVLTTMAGIACSPFHPTIPILISTTLGTALCVASANTINQWIEPPYDAQMTRTSSRILVTRSILPHRAFLIGALSGILACFVNPLTAMLGAANIILYTAIYTPMKQISIYNTHAGAIVGAIPPVMGYVAVSGALDTNAILLGMILYAWQFPHFNSLSWSLRSDYSKAGYRMMSVLDPDMCKRLALHYSVILIPVCWGFSVTGLTSVWFLLDGTICNLLFVAGAWRFYRKASEETAKPLFFASLIHLPVLLALVMFHKRALKSAEEKEDEVVDLSPDFQVAT